MPEIDPHQIRQDYSVREEAERRGIRLTKRGREWSGLSPFNAERTPSFTIYGTGANQRFHCFSSGEHGDVIDLVMRLDGCGFREACQRITGGEFTRVTERSPEDRVGHDPVDWSAWTVEPFPADLRPGVHTVFRPTRPDEGPMRVKFDDVFVYRDQAGKAIAAVMRFTNRKGNKITPFVQYCTGPQGTGLTCRTMKPRPMFGLETLAQGRQAIMVEGEKVALRMQGLFADRPVLAFGGAGAVRSTDYSPLFGRDVLLCPDHDDAGRNAMRQVAAILAPHGGRLRWLDTTGDTLEKGWDLADGIDEGWDRARVEKFIKARVGDVPGEEPPPPDDPGPPPQEPPADYDRAGEWTDGLQWGEHGLKAKSAINVGLYLRHHEEISGVFRRSDFDEEIWLVRAPPWVDRSKPWTPRRLRETDLQRVAEWLELHGLTPSPGACLLPLTEAAEGNPFHPVRDYLNGLVWDGKSRIFGWLSQYLGAPRTDYTEAVGACWLIGAVARVMDPGCKVDTMLILEGDQGTGKSSAAAMLAGPWFSDDLGEIGTKDAPSGLAGQWIIEIPELNRMRRAEVNDMKAFVSRRVDKFRPAYARLSIERPRQCVFIGTVNPESGQGYLSDVTGNRRYWPVVTGAIDMDGLERDRGQIWAEARIAYENGDPWFLSGDLADAAAAEQEERMESDPWDAHVAETLTGKPPSYFPVTAEKIMIDMGVSVEKQTQGHSGRVGRALKKLGFRAVRGGGRSGRSRLYHPPPGWVAGGSVELGPW